MDNKQWYSHRAGDRLLFQGFATLVALALILWGVVAWREWGQAWFTGLGGAWTYHEPPGQRFIEVEAERGPLFPARLRVACDPTHARRGVSFRLHIDYAGLYEVDQRVRVETLLPVQARAHTYGWRVVDAAPLVLQLSGIQADLLTNRLLESRRATMWVGADDALWFNFPTAQFRPSFHYLRKECNL